MDGDVAPINAICDLAQRYRAITYLDEVHAVGMHGALGVGIAERDGVMRRLGQSRRVSVPRQLIRILGCTSALIRSASHISAARAGPCNDS